MFRHWRVYGLLACVLVLAVVAGSGIHVQNRNRAIAEFQDRQLHDAEVVAAVLRSELTGAARTLRAIARVVSARDERATTSMLDEQTQCGSTPCFAGVAIYDAAGAVQFGAARTPTLDDEQIDSTLAWARDPANATRVQTTMAAARPPALLLITPTADGFAAAQVSLDRIFAGQQRAIDAGWPQYATVVLDDRGNVIFHSRHPEMRLNNPFRRTARCYACHESFDHVERMFRMKHGVLQYDLRGVPQLAAVAPLALEREPWIAAVMVPEESALGVLATELRQLALLMLSVVAAVGIAVHLTWKDHRRGFEAQAAAAQRASLEQSHAELTTLNRRLELAAVEWRTTVDTIDAAVVVLEPSGRIERMNRAASEMLSAAPWSWIGKASDELRSRPPWDEALALAREAIERDAVAASRIRCAATGQTWDLWCRTPKERERRGSVVIVARDVTAVVGLQESLRRSETMAALGEIVAGVAHEVRNPLFAISSMVDALSLQKGQDIGPFLGALRSEVTRLKTLMTELLEYGTPTRSVLKQHRLGPVIAEAVRSCNPQADMRGVTIEFRDGAAEADGLEMWIDPMRLLRVFINIIDNAVQHAPAGTYVTVAVSRDEGGNAVVVVRDHGPGFSAEDLPRIFTPFFSRRAGGFGLGLAITERIVGEHRGHVTAANAPDGTALEGAARVSEGAQP